MVNYCVIFGCSNRGGRDRSKHFYRLPTVIKHQGPQTEALSERRQREWLAAIGRADIVKSNYPYTRVCSDHFISGRPSSLYASTCNDWVPSLNDSAVDESSVAVTLARQSRAEERARKRQILLDELATEEAIAELCEELEDEIDEIPGVEVQTDLRSADIDLEISTLKQDIAILKKEVEKKCLDFEEFKDDDAKVCFYTGLPNWAVFLVVFEFVQSELNEKSHLPSFDKWL